MTENTGVTNTASGAAASIGAIAAMGGMMGNISETIKKSGGSEIAAGISNHIPAGTKEYLSEARAKMFNRDQLRSPTIFFGIGEEKPFYVERVASLIIERLQHNFSFFYLNYLLLSAILFTLTLLTSPFSLIGVGLLAVAWLSVIRATKEGSCKVHSFTITQKHASIVMTIVSAFVLFWLLSSIFWWTAGSSGLLTVVHAVLRDASMHKDAEDKIEMTGDIGPGSEEAFLNPPLETV